MTHPRNHSRGLSTQFFIRNLTTAVSAFVCQAVASDSLLQVDHRALVSRGDLIYLRPANGPGEGQPIGNFFPGSEWGQGANGVRS